MADINILDLFQELGLLGGLLNNVNLSRGTTVPNKYITLYNTYDGYGDAEIIDGNYININGWQSTQTGFLSSLQNLATNTVITKVNESVLQPNLTLFSALGELIEQMNVSGSTVNKSIVGDSWTAAGSNLGVPNFIFSTFTSLGQSCESLVPETLTATTITDAQNGAVSSGSEIINFVGQQSITDALNWAYNTGSGSNNNITLIDSSLSNSGGQSQWLSNGNMELWTANVPNSWHVTVGTPGTQVLQEAVPYQGTYSLGFVGDSSSLTSIDQNFGTDNSNEIYPNTQYCFNAWVKVNTPPAAGVLEFALVNGSGTIFQDGFGNNCQYNVTCSTLTSTWVPVGFAMRTPNYLGTSGIFFRMRLSTALSTSTTLYIDSVSFTQMTSLYKQGLYVAGFSGSSPTIRGDNWAITTTNVQGAFVEIFQKFFNMSQLSLLLPSSISPTISDSLVM